MKKIKSKIRKIINQTKHSVTRPWKIILKKPLKDFFFNKHSQNGEDGVIEEILRRLKIKKGWVVEFGAWDGKYLSNTFNVIEKNTNFKAVFIEGDKERFKDLVALSNELRGQIVPICAFVAESGENSLDNLLKKTILPKDFEVLSIDVDSIDYYIWKNFVEFKPKIVIIEINASLSPESKQTHDSVNNKFGSSFAATLELGNQKGYTLVYHRGNMIFVRNDLLNKTIGKESLSKQEQSLMYNRKP